MQKKHTIENEKLLDSEFEIDTEEILLCKENNKNSNGETFEHSFKKRCRWNIISDSSDNE